MGTGAKAKDGRRKTTTKKSRVGIAGKISDRRDYIDIGFIGIGSLPPSVFRRFLSPIFLPAQKSGRAEKNPARLKKTKGGEETHH
jgi:hypothetical protein